MKIIKVNLFYHYILRVCPICRDDSNIMQRWLYCSGLLVEGRDYEITHSGRLRLFVKNLIVDYPNKNHKRFVTQDT